MASRKCRFQFVFWLHFAWTDLMSWNTWKSTNKKLKTYFLDQPRPTILIMDCSLWPSRALDKVSLWPYLYISVPFSLNIIVVTLSDVRCIVLGWSCRDGQIYLPWQLQCHHYGVASRGTCQHPPGSSCEESQGDRRHADGVTSFCVIYLYASIVLWKKQFIAVI